MTTISACMIVKNEEAMLPRCLESIKWVDELIMVDTGSTDRTVEIAESYGADVHHHPWENDFSLHRNQSISYATGDWVLIIDADEEVLLDNFTKASLKQFLQKVPIHIDGTAILFQDIQREAIVMQSNATRFFRAGKVHYEGIVHNQPVLKTKEAVLMPGIAIRHYGYDLTPEAKLRKTDRTKRLLHKAVADDPDQPLHYFYLCQIYADNHANEDAARYGEEHLKRRGDIKEECQFMQSIYYTLANVYMELKDAPNADRVLKMGIEILPNSLDLFFGLMSYGIWQCDPNLVKMGAIRYIQLFEQYQKDASSKENQFVYTLTPGAFVYAMFHFIGIQAAEFLNSLNVMKVMLGAIPMDRRPGIERDLTHMLQKMNFVTQLGKALPDLIADPAMAAGPSEASRFAFPSLGGIPVPSQPSQATEIRDDLAILH